MSILFYCPWYNKDEWLKKIKKKFKKKKVYTLEDKPELAEIKCAMIWDLPNDVYKKLTNVQLLLSLGAGVEHILNMANYNKVPIIRLKNSFMGERMTNHVLSQILYYQLGLQKIFTNQKKCHWIEDAEPLLNANLSIGILGVGFLGSIVANNLLRLGYTVKGYKNFKPNKKYLFPVFYKKKELPKFVKASDIIVSILPSTSETFNFIDKKFLSLMKKRSLLINVGRGTLINEKDLIRHLRKNSFFYASLDVFKKEPLPKNHPFWKLSNIIVTPHIASLTVIDSAVDYFFKKYQEFEKKQKLKSDVNLQKGY